jgi:transposase
VGGAEECRVELVLGCSAGEDRRHANRPRRPAARRERERLEARRRRAAGLFAAGVRQAEVARRLGIPAQAAWVWHRRFKAGGPEALRSKGPSGPRRGCRMRSSPPSSRPARRRGRQRVRRGAVDVDRVALVIERLTGVRHHPAHVWALLRHRLGWTVQRPARRAAERDQAAIDQWVARDWPRTKQRPTP